MRVRILAAILVSISFLACSGADPSASDSAPETAAEEVVEPEGPGGDGDAGTEVAPDPDPVAEEVFEPEVAFVEEVSEPEVAAVEDVSEPEVAAAEDVSAPEVQDVAAPEAEVVEEVADDAVDPEPCELSCSGPLGAKFEPPFLIDEPTTFTAQVSGGCGQVSVAFLLDGNTMKVDLAPPWEVTVEPCLYVGQHEVCAVATDGCGNTATTCGPVLFQAGTLVAECSAASPAPGSAVYSDWGIALSIPETAIPPGSTVTWFVGGAWAGTIPEAPFEAFASWEDLGLAVTGTPSALAIEIDIVSKNGCTGGCSYEIQAAKRIHCSYDTQGEIWGTAAVLPSGDAVLGNLGGKLVRFDSDCEVVWNLSFGSPVNTGILFDPVTGLLFFGSLDGKFYGVDQDGEVVWSKQLGSPGNVAAAKNGKLYVPVFNKKLVVLEAATGAEEWSYEFPDYISSSPAVASDGTVYIGCQDALLYAVDEGELLWTFGASPNQIWSSPTLTPEEDALYYGSNDGVLRKISTEPALLWEADVGAQIWSEIHLASNGDPLVSALPDDVVRLSAGDGDIVWIADLTGGVTYSSPVPSPDGYVYVGSSTGLLVCLDEANGDELFVVSAPPEDLPNAFHASAALAGDRLWIGGTNRILYNVWRQP